MKFNIFSIINYFTKKPRILFLLDGLGAAMTACSLFLILNFFNEYFGMPAKMLAYLSLVGLFYCVYSLTCCILIKANWKPYLRLISILNILYCILTIVLIYSNFNYLTKLGLAYFLGEILIILSLAFIELKATEKLGNFVKE